MEEGHVIVAERASVDLLPLHFISGEVSEWIVAAFRSFRRSWHNTFRHEMAEGDFYYVPIRRAL